jgi:aspartyl protease family protein
MLPAEPDDQMRLLYLVVLLAGIVAFAFGGRRLRLGHMRDLVLWLLIIGMVMIAYGFRDTLESALFPARGVQVGEAIELRRGADGHFHAELEVNGRRVRFMVDTGASDIVLSRADAAAVGIDVDSLSFGGRAQTANGVVATAPARLGSVRFGDMADTGVPAQVNGGELDASLLGMAYLDRFDRIEISGDRMRLQR